MNIYSDIHSCNLFIQIYSDIRSCNFFIRIYLDICSCQQNYECHTLSELATHELNSHTIFFFGNVQEENVENRKCTFLLACINLWMVDFVLHCLWVGEAWACIQQKERDIQLLFCFEISNSELIIFNLKSFGWITCPCNGSISQRTTMGALRSQIWMNSETFWKFKFECEYLCMSNAKNYVCEEEDKYKNSNLIFVIFSRHWK